MQLNFQKLNHKIEVLLLSKHARFLARLLLMGILSFLWQHAFAGEDPLEGTDKSLVATLGSGGTGRKFIYLIEGVTAIATYIKTKNILMFSGVVAIAIFLNILFTVAGIS